MRNLRCERIARRPDMLLCDDGFAPADAGFIEDEIALMLRGGQLMLNGSVFTMLQKWN